MDATRADVEFTAEVCAIAVAEGANVINIPDTVGYTTPEEYTRYFARLYELAPELRDVELSVHCHDDLGLAVANSYAGLLAGARQVECAINGIGERAGNCSLEEIVMLLRTRKRRARARHRARHARARPHQSRMVSRFTGYAVQPNKAIVGRNAFAHESGIHQDGVLKERTTYEIMDATRRRPGVELDRARQALRPPRAARRARAARLQGRGQRAQPGVQALQGDRRQEEAGDRARPRGDRLRPGPRAARRATSSPGSTSRPRRRREPHGEGRGAHARRRASRSASPAATARSTRSSARSAPRPRSSPSCASTRSRRSPRARTRSAR